MDSGFYRDKSPFFIDNELPREVRKKIRDQLAEEAISQAFREAWDEVRKEWVPGMAEAIKDLDKAFNTTVDEKIRAALKGDSDRRKPKVEGANSRWSERVADVMSRQPPCFGRAVKALTPAFFRYDQAKDRVDFRSTQADFRKLCDECGVNCWTILSGIFTVQGQDLEPDQLKRAVPATGTSGRSRWNSIEEILSSKDIL